MASDPLPTSPTSPTPTDPLPSASSSSSSSSISSTATTSPHRPSTPTDMETTTAGPSTTANADSSATHHRSGRRRQKRPPLQTRKSSGSLIVAANSPTEIASETYPADDARAMSPRRSSDEIERMGDDARTALRAQAAALQESLLAIVERVERVKGEWERLDGGNRFLQSYIGELMATSKITGSGKAQAKARGR